MGAALAIVCTSLLREVVEILIGNGCETESMLTKCGRDQRDSKERMGETDTIGIRDPFAGIDDRETVFRVESIDAIKPEELDQELWNIFVQKRSQRVVLERFVSRKTDLQRPMLMDWLQEVEGELARSVINAQSHREAAGRERPDPDRY
jgi:hypothetical protein